MPQINNRCLLIVFFSRQPLIISLSKFLLSRLLMNNYLPYQILLQGSLHFGQKPSKIHKEFFEKELLRCCWNSCSKVVPYSTTNVMEFRVFTCEITSLKNTYSLLLYFDSIGCQVEIIPCNPF